MRTLYIFLAAIGLVLLLSGGAEATKPTYSCANVRCAGGSCVDTPGGPVCQTQTLSCANVLCEQGNQCVETSAGPQCRPIVTSPPGYYRPYPPQSCAYGGFYHYGRLICNPAPAWRQPYQHGWSYYNTPPRYDPPRYRPRPPWHYYGNVPEVVQPSPTEPVMCPMHYDPVCAEKPVVCVRAPCPPLRKTFGNSCQARAEDYTVLYKGQCY